MKIDIKKFGTTLTSRQFGKEAYLAFKPSMNVGPEETIEVDFMGIDSFSPSWGDEFLTPLYDEYGERLVLINTSGNASVKVTLDLLDKLEGKKFKVIN